MRVAWGPQARTYTYKEVKEMIEDVKTQMKEGFAKTVNDMVQIQMSDQLLTMTYVYLNALADMGLQKGGMENFLGNVANYADEMNDGSVGFTELAERIENILGYELEDPNREDTLNEAIQKMKG